MGSFLEVFWGAQAEKLTMRIFRCFYVCLGPFSILFIVLCCLPCCVAGGAAHMQKLENPSVLWVEKPYAPFSRSARSKQKSEDARSQTLKTHFKKKTDGARLRSTTEQL